MTDYDSPFYITNDRADLDQAAIEDGSAIVWPLSDDAKMARSPDRQYCGNYVTYGDKGGATYRHNDDTHALIAAGPNQHRDMVSSFPLVKTLAMAQARGDRQLLDVQEQDVRITTRLVDIPARRVSLAKAGMRLQIKGTHWAPSCDDWHYARILTAQPMPHSKGDLYDIDLELQLTNPGESGVTSGPPGPEYTGDVFAGLQRTDWIRPSPSVPVFAGSYNPGENVGGWYAVPDTGPIACDQHTPPYSTITVAAPMTVRIRAIGEGANVFLTSTDRTLSITVNGIVVGTDSRATGTGFVGWTREVDLRDYHLDAGDVVGVTGSINDEWGNAGINGTFLQVGRGTIIDAGTGDTVLVGP